MSRESPYALLLAAPDPVTADLARGLLEQAGVPSLLHGTDRDQAEFGTAVHRVLTRPDLYVPRAALDHAREVLVAAWGSLEPGGPIDATDEPAAGA